ncbi:MAG: DNA polymerase/3'-5' exonuclease PolX [Gemmatimonadetes bacterium]|nr:DNA polymerase/3'-5' exonuclease PolX [Gemmatimonadota bacterium]
MTESSTSAQIIHFLQRHASLMELSGANAFRVRAFANAARMLEELEVDIPLMLDSGSLTEIDGVGKGVEESVREFVEKGSTAAYEKLTEQIPETLLDLLRIPGLGTKKVKAIYDALSIASIADLAAACEDGRLDELPGFGAKTQQNILKGIQRIERFSGQFRYDVAQAAAAPLVEALTAHPATLRISVAGSLRRAKEIVKDIDIVLSCTDPAAVSAAFIGHPDVVDVIAQGERKTSVTLASGLQADLRLVDDEHFATILHHFTGSKDHNVQMRSRALARGFSLNEYGLFPADGEVPLVCSTEQDLFAALDLAYIAPELREGLGEIESADTGQLPDLIQVEDVRGQLHVHTTDSDGTDSLQQMVDGARERDCDYIGISDHSQSAGYVYGMKPADILKQHEAIDAAPHDGIRIFKGIECDILEDGRLDYDDDILATFDYVIVAIHASLNMDEATMTRRIIAAMEHDATTILAHPTGRLLLERQAAHVDIDAVLTAALDLGVVIELNALPRRLDLDWRSLRKAQEMGVLVSINTNAHSLSDLDQVALGVGIARKAWLSADQVINTWTVAALEELFQRRRG